MLKYLKDYSASFLDREVVPVFLLFLIFESTFILSLYYLPHTILILYIGLVICAFINLNMAILLLLIVDPLYFIIRNHNVADAALVAVFREAGIVLIIGILVANYLIGNTALVKRKQPEELWALLCLLLVMLFSIVTTRNFTTYLLGLRENLFPLLFLAVLILTNSAKRVEYLKIAIYIQLLTIALLEGYNLLFVGSHIFVGQVDLNIIAFRELSFISGYRVFHSMFIANPSVGSITLAGIGISLIIYSYHTLRENNFFIRIPCILLGLYLIGIALRTLSHSVILAILLVLFFYLMCNWNKKRVLLLATFVFCGLLFLFAYDMTFFLTDMRFFPNYGRDSFLFPAFRLLSTVNPINLIFGSGMGVRGGQLLRDVSIVSGHGDMVSLEYLYYFGLVGMLLYIYFVVRVLRRACFVLKNDRNVYVFFSLFLFSLFAEIHAVPFTVRPFTSLLIPLIAIIIYRARELSGQPQRSDLVPARAILDL